MTSCPRCPARSPRRRRRRAPRCSSGVARAPRAAARGGGASLPALELLLLLGVPVALAGRQARQPARRGAAAWQPASRRASGTLPRS
eukprot:3290086-Prymnesium_polylepis.1